MSEVVVVGQAELSAVPTLSESQERISLIPGGGDVISSKEFKTGRATTPQDVLGYSPGVFIQQRDTGAQESRLSIRGSGLQRTFHLRGIKILQDGIPLNQADGGGDMQRIDPLAIEYAEVFRGGNALRYGSTTLGGAINFVSPTGYDADLFQSRLEVGDFGYVRSQISSGNHSGPFDYYVSLSQFQQDGFRQHTKQDNYNIFTNFGYKIDEDWETRFYVTDIKAKAKLGGSLTKSQVFANPEQANAANISGNRKRDFDYLKVANKTTYHGDDYQWDFSAYYFTIDLFHPIFQILSIDSQDWGGEIRYTNTAEFLGRENEFVVGFSPSLGFIDDDRFANIGGNYGARTGEFDQTAYNLDMYIEDTLHMNEDWTWVNGVQLSYASREAEDYFFANGDDSGNSDYRSINPKTGVIYHLTEDDDLFAGYSRSYEPPSFSELFSLTGDYLSNKAQSSDTLEIGTRGSQGRLEYDVTAYRSWVDNELLSLSDSMGTPLGTINARSETIHQGLEVGSSFDLLRGLWVKSEAGQDKLVLRGIYNLSDFRFNGDPVYGDNRLPSIPEHFLKTELVYQHPKGFYAGVNWESVLSSYPIDMANTFFSDPYTIWGVKAGYQADKGFSLFVEGKNVSDRTYVASTGIVNNAGGLDTNAIFNPGNGAAWYGGIEWKW